MLEKLINLIGSAVSKLFSKDAVEKVIDKEIIATPEMTMAIDLWSRMYQGIPPWLSDNVKTLNISSSIASEMAKLVTLEFKSEVSNNDLLNEQYQVLIENIRVLTEYACAKGAIALKPYVSGNNIEIDIVHANNFFPTEYNSRGEISGAIFVDTKKVGDWTYTRLEEHNLNGNIYTITNKAYLNKSNSSSTLGEEIPLDSVSEWEDLEPLTNIENIVKPLFAYFKMPTANTIDTGSPLGVSIYARAVRDIEEVDKQYSRILWEYEGSELAIDASTNCFKMDQYGNFVLPSGKERLYRALDFDTEEGKAINVFSPEIRDSSLFNGLDKMLKQIEFKCGLAYGTLSDAQNVDKTATEIKSSKQRSYQSVKDIQKSLEKSLRHTVYAMEVIGMLSGMQIKTGNEVSFEWDDSIIVDKEADRLSDRADVAMGVMGLDEYRSKWMNESIEDARKNLPQQADVIE